MVPWNSNATDQDYLAAAAEGDWIRCPWCATAQDKAQALLGILGHLTHYRCRYCGGEFSKEGRR